ncbi:MAG TPA: hypothetical protein DDZ96_08410 [Porphyromonadaceae bacterium]|jgi:hypothetical protein|nr:hypothetical protein [Porphyromonadaceae bacterium]HBL33827.1 hypothetical protein [Porphyromonadaceae bacterium]HBX20590.1 hypothetical protein [Porphyromonadaceae bacterium]HBX44686.1 hypothetical protein [Porphyromonadaceae bacterium]HCM21356.1 hypothetical protein [Porphyromonadaceae bacterium]
MKDKDENYFIRLRYTKNKITYIFYRFAGTIRSAIVLIMQPPRFCYTSHHLKASFAQVRKRTACPFGTLAEGITVGKEETKQIKNKSTWI